MQFYFALSKFRNIFYGTLGLKIGMSYKFENIRNMRQCFFAHPTKPSAQAKSKIHTHTPQSSINFCICLWEALRKGCGGSHCLSICCGWPLVYIERRWVGQAGRVCPFYSSDIYESFRSAGYKLFRYQHICLPPAFYDCLCSVCVCVRMLIAYVKH